MTDYMAIGLTHFLLLLAAWRLLKRSDLDRESGPGDRPRGRGAMQPVGQSAGLAQSSAPFAPGFASEGDSRRV
jgi:hypothetical protein